jgi:hypothetical protein
MLEGRRSGLFFDELLKAVGANAYPPTHADDALRREVVGVVENDAAKSGWRDRQVLCGVIDAQ